MPLRGHRDDNREKSLPTSRNPGNFKAILELFAETDEILKNHLEYGKKNAKYTSKTIQNSIIEVIGQYVRKTIVEEITTEDAVFFIIADEVTDKHANQEVLSLSLRFLIKNEIKEEFLDFINLDRTTGKAIADAILKSLRENGLDIQKCRDQAYDGASAMSLSVADVHGQIKLVAPLALYQHCRNHVLNLAIADSCKFIPIRNMVGSLNEVYLFFDLSPKRQRFLERFIEKSSKTKILGLFRTRWVERHKCYDVFAELYVEICSCLCAILFLQEYPNVYGREKWDWDQDSRTKGNGLLHTMRFSILSSLSLLRNTF